MSTTISIGIFAHNEATCITSMLESLRKQTIFAQADQPELFILENGSTDNTAECAQAAIQSHFQNIPARVECLTIGDKGQTWNEFVHRISDPSAEFLLFLDADIELGDNQTLEHLVSGLLKNPDACVTVSRPTKDIAKKEQKSGLEKLSLSGSATAQAGPAQLCGQLYCARAKAMRQLHIPRGLLVEDGFLRALILTQKFTQPEKVEWIINTPAAFHYFEALTQIKELVKHEKRLAIGTELNIMLFSWSENLHAKGKAVSTEIDRLNQSNPDWVKDMAEQQVKNNTFAFHTSGYIFKQARNWIDLPTKKKIRAFPGLIARLGLNTIATLSARQSIKKGKWNW